jgi:V/A-type H+-transporting ATPase subunit B
MDKKFLKFAIQFERELIGQGWTRRTIDESLDASWKLLSQLPRAELTRIDTKYVDLYYKAEEEAAAAAPVS